MAPEAPPEQPHRVADTHPAGLHRPYRTCWKPCSEPPADPERPGEAEEELTSTFTLEAVGPRLDPIPSW